MIDFRAESRVLFLISCCLFLLAGFVDAQILPTNEWVNFFSQNTSVKGMPASVGTIIDAYDPDSVHCGSFTVRTLGEYGFLFVYRDDELTPGIDEGAVPGDTITFKINGIPAHSLGPDANVWTQKGDIIEVDLADNLPPEIALTLNHVVVKEDEVDRIIADLDTIFFDPDRDSLSFFVQSNAPEVGPLIDEENRLSLSLKENWSGSAVISLKVTDKWFEVYDTLLVDVIAINDPPEIILNLPDIMLYSDSTQRIDLHPYAEDIDSPESSLIWTASVHPPHEDSLIVEIDNDERIATISAKYFFSADVNVVFTVTDDSAGFDQDTILVHVKLPVGIEHQDELLRPQYFYLQPGYPNPFNSSTRINYQLPKLMHVHLKILNSLGQELATLVDEPQIPGYYSINWDGKDQSTGLYFIWLKAGEFSQVRKILVLR